MTKIYKQKHICDGKCYTSCNNYYLYAHRCSLHGMPCGFYHSVNDEPSFVKNYDYKETTVYEWNYYGTTHRLHGPALVETLNGKIVYCEYYIKDKRVL